MSGGGSGGGAAQGGGGRAGWAKSGAARPADASAEALRGAPVAAAAVLREIPGDRVQVIAHRGAGALGVSGQDRFEDPAVLRQGALLAVLRAREREAGEQQRGVDALDQPFERLVAGGGDERLVERDVGLVEHLLGGLAGGPGGRVLHAPEGRRQRLLVRLARPLRRERRRLHLEHAPAL